MYIYIFFSSEDPVNIFVYFFLFKINDRWIYMLIYNPVWAGLPVFILHV